MTKKRSSEKNVTDLLLDLQIIQLGIAGVSQQAIRGIVGCDIVRVNRILKHMNSGRKKQHKA